jgi:cell division protein FtsB
MKSYGEFLEETLTTDAIRLDKEGVSLILKKRFIELKRNFDALKYTSTIEAAKRQEYYISAMSEIYYALYGNLE